MLLNHVTKLYLTELTETYEHPNSKIKAEVTANIEFGWNFKIKPETFGLGYTVVFPHSPTQITPPSPPTN